MFTIRKRTIFSCLTVLVILSMTLAACAPATSQPATSTPFPQVPTYTPYVEVKPTATTAAAATATKAAAATATTAPLPNVGTSSGGECLGRDAAR